MRKKKNYMMHTIDEKKTQFRKLAKFKFRQF